MKLKVVWSEFAENEIDKIYNYYLQKAGIKVAKKLLKKSFPNPTNF